MKEAAPIGGTRPERTPLIEIAGKKFARRLGKHPRAPKSIEKKPVTLETKEKKGAAKELGKTKAGALGIKNTVETTGNLVILALLGSVMLTDQFLELLTSLDKDFQKGWHSGKSVFSNKRGKEK